MPRTLPGRVITVHQVPFGIWDTESRGNWRRRRLSGELMVELLREMLDQTACRRYHCRACSASGQAANSHQEARGCQHPSGRSAQASVPADKTSPAKSLPSLLLASNALIRNHDKPGCEIELGARSVSSQASTFSSSNSCDSTRAAHAEGSVSDEAAGQGDRWQKSRKAWSSVIATV